MDETRVDSLARAVTAMQSRRGTLAALLGGTLGLLALTESDAKKKKGKKKKKKKKKTTPPPPPPPRSPPPPPPLPVATADASCVAPILTEVGGSNFARMAQTFRALRTGQMTSASVYLRENAEGANFDLEIWSVDAANAPGAVLAGTTIANVPASPPERKLSATFPTPANVVAGTRYALVVTPSSSTNLSASYEIDYSCADGMYFYSTSLGGDFTAVPEIDLKFETVVTA